MLTDKLMYMKSCYLIKESGFSNAQFYNWLKNIHERKKRDKKFISQDVAEVAVKVIKEYPHFSANKGQGYMIYHQKGYIPQHIYKLLKKVTKRLIFQEVSKRGLLPVRGLASSRLPGDGSFQGRNHRPGGTTRGSGWAGAIPACSPDGNR